MGGDAEGWGGSGRAAKLRLRKPLQAGEQPHSWKPSGPWCGSRRAGTRCGVMLGAVSVLAMQGLGHAQVCSHEWVVMALTCGGLWETLLSI